MDTRLKKILTVFCCLMLTVVIYLYMCMVVTPKDITNSGGPLYYRGMGFMSEPKNSIDVMVYGNSDVYSGFIPAKLVEKYGYSAYASGRANQTVGEAVNLLGDTLKTQTPKVVILETDCFFTNEKRVKLDTGNILLAPFVYHSRWKEISFRDFHDIPNRKNVIDLNKGFIPSNLTFDADEYKDYMADKGKPAAKITDKNMKAISKFVNICKDNNIAIIFLELASPSSWNYSKHKGVSQVAEELEVPFVDMNMPLKGYNMNLDTDFRDNGNHMNTVGASKATESIGALLSENYKDLLVE